MAKSWMLDRRDVLETIRQSDGLQEAYISLAKLPAVDVRENVKATVIRDKNDNEICSNCGCHLLTMYTVHDRLVLQPSFCPNCGAQMGGAEDER